MSQLPAYCPECHALFPAPLAAEGPTDVTFFDIPVRCARCGASGHIPADVREWVGQIVEAARSAPPEGRDALRATLDGCREDGAGPAECLDRLRRLESDEAEPAAVFRRMEYRELDFAPLVAAAGAAALDLLRGEDGEMAGEAGREELVNWTMDHLLEEYGEEPGPGREPSEAERRLSAAGRNDPCPCGSGDKYKDCHWIEDLRESRS